MIKIKRLLAIAACCSLSGLLEAEEFHYEADWDSIRSHYQVPEWFRDAKFGIFLHWGPYTVPAYGVTKYPKYMYYPGWKTKKGQPLFEHHVKTYGPQSEFGYKDFIPRFKAEKFDAEAWVALFKEAGAKYLVPVAEHHDGFAMYASKHTPWNVKNMGPKRDTMRELAAATHAAGLKFGVSSHLAWSHVEGQEFKTSGYLLDELIDIVSKNGCLLLNVGPKADGTITDEETAILKEMGAWLKLNGEAIYKTRPWKIYGEGPTKVSAGHHSEHENADNVAADVRFTLRPGSGQAGDDLYAIALAWPDDGKFVIQSLAKNNPYESRAIQSIDFISGSKPVKWRQTKDGLVIRGLGKKPCEAAYVFRINFDS